MGSNLSFFAGGADDRDLVSFGASLGLEVVPSRWDDEKGVPSLVDPLSWPACYFSPKPLGELHPWGEHPIRKIGEPNDPLIEFQRSYYKPPHLVAGRLWWPGYPDELAKISKPYFEKLRRWLKKNWRRREEDNYFIGPEAERLVAEEKAMLCYLPPFTPITTVPI